MTRLLYYGLSNFRVLFFVFLVSIQGCARPILQTYPANEQDIEKASEAFARFRKLTIEECGCCLDAEADAALSVSGWFRDHTGKFSGYLQAMKPGFIKFVAINPLGQPLFILATNGRTFKGLNVFDGKAYLGSVHSETFTRFTPPGFDPAHSYYWLTGRLAPGEIQIKTVMRDRDQKKFWLQINHANESKDSMVLFDPEELVILRHVLRDEHGDHILDVLYADHQWLPKNEGNSSENGPARNSVTDGAAGLCNVPARITVSSNNGAEKMEVKLHSFINDAHFSAADFHLEVPDNFEQLLVK